MAELWRIESGLRDRARMTTDRADLVVVGAGTIGGWASVFAAEAGVGRVVVLERGLAGDGASSRAAGIVRAQGGTPATVALGRWSIAFYRGQAARYGTDSGFREHGYVILALTEEDERAGRERVAMQRAAGLDVRWVDAAEAAAIAGTLAPTGHRGGSYLATDGAISPPRNVRAYSLAMATAGVELRERTALTGVTIRDGRVVGVETTAGPIETDRVILTGGPSLRAVGRLAGLRIPAGAVRHTVAVTEPHPAFDLERAPMVFDIGARPLLAPRGGRAPLRLERPRRCARRGPGDRLGGPRADEGAPRLARPGDAPTWACGRCGPRRSTTRPTTCRSSGRASPPPATRIEGLTVASAGGHGMMWGPAVARVAADLAVHGRTELTDIAELGLDRFDEHGRSRLAPDPIALPFPADAGETRRTGRATPLRLAEEPLSRR